MSIAGVGSVLTSAPIVALRIVESGRVITMPDRGECLIGSSPDCAVQLPTNARVAGRHARLVNDGAECAIHDLGSDAGTWIDGVRVRSRVLVPGTEIRIGGVVVAAESMATLSVLRMVECLVGFGAKRRAAVARATRGVIEFARGRSALVLVGRGELAGIAAGFHRLLVGAEHPFVVVEPGGRLARGVAGTVCMEARSLRSASDPVVERAQGADVRFVICAPTLKAAGLSLRLGRVAAVEVAPLEERRRELARIIEERALDAAAELDQASTGLDRQDRALLGVQSYRSFAHLDETVRRLVAIRTLGVTRGAGRLGLTHSALSQWGQRHPVPRRGRGGRAR